MKNLLARMALVWQLNLAVASFHIGDGVRSCGDGVRCGIATLEVRVSCGDGVRFGVAVASFHISDGVRFGFAVASFHMGIASWEIWAKGWEGSRRLLG